MSVALAPPKSMSALVPRDYQSYGIHFLRANKRALLTDDAGLGKTLQASEAATLPALVVCPAYLIDQWHEYLTTQYPTHKVIAVYGQPDRRLRLLNKAARADWTIVGYPTLRIYLENVPEVSTVIFDESHHLRNRTCGQSKAADNFVNPSKRSGRKPIENVFMLSATPMWKRVDDLWMQLHILQPEIFPSYERFLDLYCTVISNGFDRRVVRINKYMQRHLDEMLKIIKLGRTYTEVGRVLPPIINKFVRVDLPPKLRETYNTVRDNFLLEYGDGDEEFMILNHASVMHSLRQITGFSGKITAAVEAVNDTEPTKEHPTIVFCWYRDTADSLYKAFGSDRAVLITGGTDYRFRRAHALTKPIVVATIPALREGVNLSHGRNVVFFEEDWPPGSNYQALRRVQRDRNLDADTTIDPVIVTYIHVSNTLYTIIHKVSKQRTASMKELMKEIFQ
jgi:hypothetical protein